MVRIKSLHYLLALSLLCSAAQAWQEDQTVLANEGRVYVVLSGTYGELFPNGSLVPGHHRILALDVLHPEGSIHRSMVPGTLGPDVDASPSAAYDEASDSLGIVWEKQFPNGVTTLNLLSFSAGDWSPIREITGHTRSRKWSPSVAITQDLDQTDGSERTLFHVIWAEGVFGYESTFYSPVLLVDGSYVGSNPVLRLADWSPPSDSVVQPGHALLRAPSEQLGSDRGTLVVGAASAATGRLLSFDLKVHPAVMGRVADGARGQILSSDPSLDLESLVDEVRAHIIIAGAAFQPAAMIQHLAGAAEATVRDLHGSGDLESLAAAVRAHIIIAGDRWLFPRRNRGPLRMLDAAGGEADWTHIVSLSSLPGRPLPELDPISETPRILLSGNGREALVAWRNEGRWRYVESHGNTWSDTHSVHQSLGDDPAALDRIFERRIQTR